MEDWTVQAIASSSETRDWESVAQSLGHVLGAVRAAVSDAGIATTDGPHFWHDGDGAAAADLLAVVLSRRERHDDGDLVDGAASVGDLRGGAGLVGVSWELGGRPGTGSVRVRFDAHSAGPLYEQVPAWLAALLCDVAAPVDAHTGAITTRALFRALGKRGASLAVGAVTLLPDGLPVGSDARPEFTVLPAGAGYPHGCVLVADLDQVHRRPDDVADALVGIDGHLHRQGESTRP